MYKYKVKLLFTKKDAILCSSVKYVEVAKRIIDAKSNTKGDDNGILCGRKWGEWIGNCENGWVSVLCIYARTLWWWCLAGEFIYTWQRIRIYTQLMYKNNWCYLFLLWDILNEKESKRWRCRRRRRQQQQRWWWCFVCSAWKCKNYVIATIAQFTIIKHCLCTQFSIN